jgi:hypothetical protein
MQWGSFMMEDIIIEEKKMKAMLMAAAGLLMFVASILLWIIGMNEKIMLYCIFGVILSIVFGIGFLILLSLTFESKPLLTITIDGIIDNSSAGSSVNIGFQDIERFCIVSLYGKNVIGVIPKDEKTFIDKLSTVKQMTAKSKVSKNCPPFFIRVERAKDMSLEDIFTLLKKRLDDYSCLYD